MSKMFEVRYRNQDKILAHQYASENSAKSDAKQLSLEFGFAMLGEVDCSNDNLIRACEYVGGVQQKWFNRSEVRTPCKIVLTLEDTRALEPASNVEVKPKPQFTDEERAEKKAALARIRETQKSKETKVPVKSSSSGEKEKTHKLIANGFDANLVDIITKSNIHEGSPNFNALVALWKGSVTEQDYPNMKPKDLNKLMNKLRALLIANETGKSIVTKTIGKGLSYRLVDFKLEIIEEVA